MERLHTVLLTDNKEKIELFGMKLFLSERTARDVNNLDKHFRNSKNDFQEVILQRIIVIRDGLRINFKILKWWNIVRRFKLRKICKEIFLFENLSPSKIIELSNKVFELEGIEVKKKESITKARTELAVTLQPD